jgi:hypothetical protein
VIGDSTYADAILDRLSTTPTASISPATACDGPDRAQPQRIDPNLASRQKTNRQQDALKRATSSRNSERHDLGMTRRHHRNKQVRCSSADLTLAAPALPLEIRGNQRLGSVGHFRRQLPRQSGLEGNG